MDELKKIESSLERLHTDFNRQLEYLGSDTKEFHNALIDLSAKYPDHKELLQFIVFINDKLETNQTLFSEIVVDSFNELVKLKQDLVKDLIAKEKPNKSFFEKLKEVGFSNIKYTIIALAVIIFSIGVIVKTDAMNNIASSILELKK